MYRLNSYDSVIPNGYYYVQTINGKNRTCGPSPSVEDVARCALAFRTGNGLARASFTEALQDVNEYTCARLGNTSSYCTQCDEEGFLQANARIPGVKPCGSCGVPVS
jgi:hypothetical protein